MRISLFHSFVLGVGEEREWPYQIQKSKFSMRSSLSLKIQSTIKRIFEPQHVVVFDTWSQTEGFFPVMSEH